jgi:hypothetical protein
MTLWPAQCPISRDFGRFPPVKLSSAEIRVQQAQASSLCHVLAAATGRVKKAGVVSPMHDSRCCYRDVASVVPRRKNVRTASQVQSPAKPMSAT